MAADAIFSKETFKFFRELGRNNHKAWMDENRHRYRSLVVEPFRKLLDCVGPAAQKLNRQFVVSGRTGDNFSRINRDIRFAADKSPYRGHMYLHFAEPGAEGGQLYAGISAEAATSGFRIYGMSKESPLAQIARPRGRDNAKWIEGQRRRLGKKYDSYWYASEKGEWTKHNGWPAKPEDWKKIQGWVVRKKFAATAATRASFPRDITAIFRDVYPLYEFTTSPRWKK